MGVLRFLQLFVVIVFLPITFHRIYSQQQTFEEFMEWCLPQFGENCSQLYEESNPVLSYANFDLVIFILLVVIGFSILGNYLWGKRKGRKYSEE